MITLQKIDTKNIWAVIKLSVNPEQENFVATNTESILEAYANLSEGNVAMPFAIYNDGCPIGFVMFGYGTIGDQDEPAIAAGNYVVWRFMIDRQYQGKGYGKKALAACLGYLRTLPCGPAQFCWLSYEPENTVAKALYSAAGFVENGEKDGDEIVAVRAL